MKPIANHEQRYLITHKGEVINLANNTALTPIRNPNGYLKVGLADGKEMYLKRVLAGEQVKDIAAAINRRPETLHGMLRTTATRLGLDNQWETQMKENRRVAAIRNLNLQNT